MAALLGHPLVPKSGVLCEMVARKQVNTRSAQTMAKKFVGWPVTQRMAEAVRLVMEENWNQTQAAKFCGVSRPRLNVNVKAAKEKVAESQRRSEAARAERVAAFEIASSVPETPDSGPGLQDSLPEVPQPELIIAQPHQVLGLLNETRRVPPPGEFVRMYFGNVICPDCGVHHEVPPFHDVMLDKLADPAIRRLLINVAPYHAKSTIGTVYDSVRKICLDPNIRIGIVSKAERLAKNFLYQIKRFLSDPMVYGSGPNLIDDWGPFFSIDNWNATDIRVLRRTSSEKDPTVAVFGTGALIYGYRFDEMKFDDIADLENQRNPDRVAEQLAWATQECASRVGKTGKLSFMGTRISPNDIYSHLQNLPAYHVVRFPCITDEVEQTTLWPEHFPYVSAAEQRDSMSLEQFQLVYQNIDTPGFGAAFPLDVLEACQDSEMRLGMWESSWKLVLGVDPAGAGEQAGFTAMVVLAVDMKTGERFIVDVVNHKQMRAPQIKDQIIAFAEQYPLSEIRVEVNGLQSQLFQYDFELINRLTNRGIRFVPHITGRNKWDPQFGVESMGPMFYNRQIHSSYGDINSRKKVGQLHEQLAQFPMGQVTDLVMALWFAELGCREIFQRFRLPAFDERMKVPSRIRRKRVVVDFGAQEVRSPRPDEIANPHRQPVTHQYVNMPGGVTVY